VIVDTWPDLEYLDLRGCKFSSGSSDVCIAFLVKSLTKLKYLANTDATYRELYYLGERVAIPKTLVVHN